MEQKNNDKNFLGIGWSFPPTFLPNLGGVLSTSGQEDIQASLEILLSTALGERVMLPNYGSQMDDLVFAPLDTATQTLIVDRIRNAILYHESRISTEQIELMTDQLAAGLLIVKIVYRVRSTNSRYNFVYPYYLTEGTEVNPPTKN